MFGVIHCIHIIGVQECIQGFPLVIVISCRVAISSDSICGIVSWMKTNPKHYITIDMCGMIYCLSALMCFTLLHNDYLTNGFVKFNQLILCYSSSNFANKWFQEVKISSIIYLTVEKDQRIIYCDENHNRINRNIPTSNLNKYYQHSQVSSPFCLITTKSITYGTYFCKYL